jgi:hypothetical protein
MHTQQLPLPFIFKARAGIATLEFVMALPVLLLLMVAITWLGFSVIGQTEVLVEARNEAWGERFKNAADNPLSFPLLPEHDLPFLPKYVASEDYVTKTASKKVEVSPIFNALPGPKAGHTILAGSWDYEAMPLDTPPDFKLMAKAAAIGAFGNILDLAASADDPLGLMKKILDVRTKSQQLQSQNDTAQTNVGKDDSPVEGGGGAGGGGGGITAEQAQEKSEADLKKHKEELIAEYKKLGGKVELNQDVVQPINGLTKAAEDALSDAMLDSEQKSKLARDAQDEEQKKKLQAEAAQAHRKVELARVTLERLKADCIDIANEAEGLDINRFQLNAAAGFGFGF